MFFLSVNKLNTQLFMDNYLHGIVWVWEVCAHMGEAKWQ